MKNLGAYYKLSFIIASVGSLKVNLGVTLCIFITTEVGNFLGNKIDLITIKI